MQGHREPNTTLYMINMAEHLREMKEQHITDTLRAHYVYETKSKQELTLFYHATCFSPTKQTFVDAIKRNDFASWSGLQWSSSTRTYQEQKQSSKDTSDSNTKESNQLEFIRRSPL